MTWLVFMGFTSGWDFIVSGEIISYMWYDYKVLMIEDLHYMWYDYKILAIEELQGLSIDSKVS